MPFRYHTLSFSLVLALGVTGPLLAAETAPNVVTSATTAVDATQASTEKNEGQKTSVPKVKNYASRTDVLDFLNEVSKTEKVPLEWLRKEVAAARYSPLTEKYSTPKPNANRKTTPERNFQLYRRNLVTNERIQDGATFVERNLPTLERMEKELGVDRHAVAAVIGIESIYGKNMGRFRVLDALMTLSFDYTRRASYYRKELASYLAFCYEQGVSATSIYGSFAGAIGLGQFMPTSLLAYGKDGNGDGHIDIVTNEADGIASVANFLAVHGWKRGEQPLYRVEANDTIFRETKSGGIKPHTTMGTLLQAGVKPVGNWSLPDEDRVLLVDLPWIAPDNTKGTDYYIGTPSFSAILHYNRSYFYAAAVSMLADEIRSEIEQKKSASVQLNARKNTRTDTQSTEVIQKSPQ